jgi:serine O-acetyltransferase
MIANFEDLQRYLKEDLAANGLTRWHWWDRMRNPTVAFERKLRRTEFVLNTLKGPVWKVMRAYCRWRLRVSGMKLGFTIPPNVFGPGLALPHWGTIVINPDCRVGARCRMHPGVCLGWHDGKVPMLGDDCYLGPGAKLYGGVVLGDKTKVGPNTVVGRSYPEGGAVLVAPREYNVRAVTTDGAEFRAVAEAGDAKPILIEKIVARHLTTEPAGLKRTEANHALEKQIAARRIPMRRIKAKRRTPRGLR